MRTSASVQNFTPVDVVTKDGTRIRARFTFQYGSVLIYDLELRSGPKGLKVWTPRGACIHGALLGYIRKLARDKLVENEGLAP